MHIRRTLVVLFSAGLLLSSACGKKKSGSSSKQAKTYPETKAGLEKQLSEVVAAINEGDKAGASKLCVQWAVPNYQAWFKKVFGDARGAKLAAFYGKFKGILNMVPGIIEKTLKKGQTQIVVHKITDPKGMETRGLQSKALSAMKEKTPLWDVRFVKPGKRLGFALWSFVYVDGRFRFIGKLKKLNDKPPTKVEKMFDELTRRDVEDIIKKKK